MKKLLCVTIVLIMTLSLMAIPVNADTTEAEPVELSPAEIYEAAEDGDLLQTVNFKADYWSDEFASASNSGATFEISEDGSLVKLTELNESHKRAMWGGIDEASRFPLREVTEVIENPDDPDKPTYVYGDKQYKYTLVFDVKFGKGNTGNTCVGIQIDGDNTLLIDGNGHNYWYTWNTKSVDKPSDNYDRWSYISNVAKADTHTFAVEIDPEKNEMTLYVANKDGSFGEVRTLTYDGAKIGNTLKCAVYTRALSGTPDSSFWMELSNLQIYKGLVAAIESDDGTTDDGNDNTGNDNTGNDNTGNDNTGNDNTGNDNTGNDNTGNDNTGNDNTGNDNTGNDNTGNDNTGNDNTGNDNTGNDNTGNDSTGNNTTGNNNTNTDTNAPETNAPETEAETEAEKSGCGASVAMTGVALVGTCAAVLAIKRRKNED